MHSFPVVLLFWTLSVTAFPPSREDDQKSAEDYLESVQIQRSRLQSTTRRQRPNFLRRLDPEVLQDYLESVKIQRSGPQGTTRIQHPGLFRRLDPEVLQDYLESVKIQRNRPSSTKRTQRPGLFRRLDPEVLQDNLEHVKIQKSRPPSVIFGKGQLLSFVRRLDPEVIKVNRFGRGFMKVAKYSPVTRGSIWKSKDLTYRIVNYGTSLSPVDVVFAIERAFKVWSDVTPLTFTRVYSKGDIELAFVTGDHNDNNPFDQHTDYLAHAFEPGPNIGGDVHFNDAKRFTKTADLYNFFLVATHEIGHALGLQHSDGQIDLMNSHYQMTEPKGFRLPQNDIDAIQRLYGSSPINPSARGPSICDSGRVYDAVTTIHGDMFFFTERFVLRRFFQSGEVEMDFIQRYWNFLPNDVDAAYEDSNSDTMFVFKGPKYWETSSDLSLKSKGSIYNFGFPYSVKSIDAAVFVPDIEKTYFFVGNQYWRYNEKIQAMDKGFPRPIPKDFPGVGPKITAAMYSNGRLYLFDTNALHEVKMNATGQIVGRIQKLPKNFWMKC